MALLIPFCLVAELQEATDAADRQLDEYVRIALKNVDISVDPWASRIEEIRRDSRQTGRTRVRYGISPRLCANIWSLRSLAESRLL